MNLNLDYNQVRSLILAEINKPNGVKLRDDNERSVWMRIVAAVSWAFVYFINPLLQYVFASIFPKTADRYAMRFHLAEEGLELKDAVKAVGSVRIGSKTKPTMKYAVPQNLVIYTEGKTPLYFETAESSFIDPATLPDSKGFYTAAVKIQALTTGSIYNVPAETIVLFDNAPDGVDVVFNSDPVTGGDEEESLEAAYKRLQDSKTGTSRGTLTWFVSETEKNFPEIEQAWGIPRYAGRGTVGIVVAGRGGDASSETLSAIESYFNTDDNDPAGAYHVIASRPQIVLTDYNITIWYDANSEIPSDTDLLFVLNTYLAGLIPGEDQIITSLQSRFLTAGLGIKDVKINNPTGNIIVPKLHVSRIGNIIWNKIAFTDEG